MKTEMITKHIIVKCISFYFRLRTGACRSILRLGFVNKCTMPFTLLEFFSITSVIDVLGIFISSTASSLVLIILLG